MIYRNHRITSAENDCDQKENGIHPRELDTARFWVKQELEGKHLPFLPEHVDRRLFFEGRTAWSYKYSDLHVDQRKASKTITFNVVALLKKSFIVLLSNIVSYFVQNASIIQQRVI